MAQLQLIKHSSGILIPATPDTSDYLHSKIKLGAVLVADFKRVRNPAFHRRFFALLNLGFEYWEPTGGAISSNERKLVTGYARYLAAFGGSESSLLDAAEQYLDRVASKRITSGSISACKSFDAYRAWVTVEAGHYDANQHAKQQIAMQSQRAATDIKDAIAADDCARRPVPIAAANRLREYAYGLRAGSSGTATGKPDS